MIDATHGGGGISQYVRLLGTAAVNDPTFDGYEDVVDLAPDPSRGGCFDESQQKQSACTDTEERTWDDVGNLRYALRVFADHSSRPYVINPDVSILFHHRCLPVSNNRE
jgi:hypothetical protein